MYISLPLETKKMKAEQADTLLLLGQSGKVIELFFSSNKGKVIFIVEWKIRQ